MHLVLSALNDFLYFIQSDQIAMDNLYKFSLCIYDQVCFYFLKYRSFYLNQVYFFQNQIRAEFYFYLYVQAKKKKRKREAYE